MINLRHSFCEEETKSTLSDLSLLITIITGNTNAMEWYTKKFSNAAVLEIHLLQSDFKAMGWYNDKFSNANIFQVDHEENGAADNNMMEIDCWCGVPLERPVKPLLTAEILKDLNNISINERKYTTDALNGLEKLTSGKPMGYCNHKEADLLEKYVRLEIEDIRRKLNAPLVDVSQELSSAGRTVSHFYFDNGPMYKTVTAYQYLSYMFDRKEGKSLRSYARVLAKHWMGKKSILEQLSNRSLTELGVGVCCSPKFVVISVLRY